MKPFLRKLFYFGIGVFLGSLVVKALFGGRDLQCSYFPNDRVLSDMRKKELHIAPYAECLMECHLFADSNMAYVLREAKIDFSKSEAKADKVCKKYPLYWTSAEGEVWEILAQNCTEELKILSVKPEGAEKECLCP